jgi:hypothetical protein
MCTETSFLRGKDYGHEDHCSPPSSARVKNFRDISTLPHTSSWHGIPSFVFAIDIVIPNNAITQTMQQRST